MFNTKAEFCFQTDIYAYRQTDMQTDRHWQKCRKIEEQAGRQTQWHTKIQTDRQTDIQTDEICEKTKNDRIKLKFGG